MSSLASTHPASTPRIAALVDIGTGKALDTTNIKDPVIGFIFGQKGLMYNLTLEGAKFTKLDKK